MTPTRPSTLAVITLALVPLGWLLEMALQARGGSPLTVPVGSLLVLGLIAVVVLAAAWPVRRWTVTGVRSGFFSPLRAARAAVMAKAASHCGAVLIGWWLGNALFLLPDLGIESLRRAFWRLILGVVLALGVLVAGLVAERWCRLPPEDSEKGPESLDPEPT